MFFSSNKSLNLLCIAGYLLFMSLAFDSSVVDAVVFYVSDQNNNVVLRSGEVKLAKVEGETPSPLVAVQFKVKREEKVANLHEAELLNEQTRTEEADSIENVADSSVFKAPPAEAKESHSGSDDAEDEEVDGDDDEEPKEKAKVALPAKVAIVEPIVPKREPPPEVKKSEKLSVLAIINSLPEKKWELDLGLNRYMVRYDKDTIIVLTIRPYLQHLVENVFKEYRCKIGAGIIQDPSTGAILAMTSYDGKKTLSPTNPDYKEKNWALKPTFPVASIFKIVAAAAGISKKKVSPNSRIKVGRKSRMELWRAFAKSHNGVFGVVGRAVGRNTMQFYADAFGFNKPFFFDLPVLPSEAKMPANSYKLGRASAGLNKNFETSPIHVSSIVSTVLNRGRCMKPYLVDFVLHKGKVIFRRRPFQLGQPISTSVAEKIYEMMKTTTTHGTGKKGFNRYSDFPGLAELCGGKTGTLTGKDPNYLFTWFGGFTRTAGRDLCITTLVGGGKNVKAATIAGKISYKLHSGKRRLAKPIVAKVKN